MANIPPSALLKYCSIFFECVLDHNKAVLRLAALPNKNKKKTQN